MDERQLKFMRDLTGAPGPSGFEGPVRAVWRASVSEFATDVGVDALGSITATVNPAGAPRVMLAGHIDEIGLMVTSIDSDGFLYFAPIGGQDTTVLVAQRVFVHTASGPILGVLGRKPAHLTTSEDRKTVPAIGKLWIDIGVSDRAEAASVVRIGDPVTFAATLDRLRGNLLVSKAFDNRVGAYVAAEAARAVAADSTLSAAVFAVGTSQEEIGYRGAIASAERIKPDVAIAIDVGFGLDHPELDDEKRQHNDFALGKGPQISRGANVNPVVFDMMVAAADAVGIPYQTDPSPGESGTDSWGMQVAHHGVATGIISVSLRYMHSPVEVLSTTDLDAAVLLLATFIRRLNKDSNFIAQ